MKIALEARKNKDLKTLKDINIEFSSRVSLKEFKEKNPTKTSLKRRRTNENLDKRT